MMSGVPTVAMKCPNGHDVRLPIIAGGKLRPVTCWACVAGVK